LPVRPANTLYFGGIRYLIYLLAPIVFFFSSIPPVTSQSSTLLIHILPSRLASESAVSIGSRTSPMRMEAFPPDSFRWIYAHCGRFLPGRRSSFRSHRSSAATNTSGHPVAVSQHPPHFSIGPLFIRAKERMQLQLAAS
jgi:hypothetical protein